MSTIEERKPSQRKPSLFLSKSLFVRGLQCHKSLWLHKYHPELKDELSVQQAAILQNGREVGKLAQGLFPGGVEVPYGGLSHAEQVERTRALIGNDAGTIYEATFGFDGVFVKVDILHRGTNGWELYEVKASATVENVHLYDVALQLHVLAGAELPLTRASVVHIDNAYTRCGELELDRLFAVEDVTQAVREMQAEVTTELIRQRTMLLGEMPAIDIGPYCSDPYDCDFKGHCWQHIPEESVFDLRGRGADKFGLYRQGFVRMSDIPLALLNDNQRFQVVATLEQRDSVQPDRVRAFLDTLWYPLCYLDFETFTSPIPLFDDSRPYQQIPFQFSLHTQTEAGSEPAHLEYLARPGFDPREELLARLLDAIPEEACVLTYNQTFEIGVLRGLAELFPDRRERIERMLANVRDLMLPFRKRDVYLWQMKGSYSIKEVLPALVPELTYEGMDIADGGAAMEAYHLMGRLEDQEVVERVRRALLNYCRLDTLAMVKIVERLRGMAEG